MQIWFTADHHLGHFNIISHCQRPFQNLEEMDETLVANWNARVGKKDLVYHLGDIVFRSSQHPQKYLDRLNGKIHLIRGNHDKDGVLKKCASHFSAVDDLKTIKINGQKIVLCHYAMRVWDCSHWGSWHLYGHSHGQLPGVGFSFDVGVDCHNFQLWSYEEIVEKMGPLEP